MGRPFRAPPHSRGDKAVPWPRFSFYTHAESGSKCAAESREMGRSGSRARGDRPSKKPTPLPQRRRPHANQIKGRSRLVVRPQGRESQRVRRTETELLRDADLAAGLGNALGDMPRFFCLQCPLSFVLYAPSKQSREARPCVFSMQCLLLEKRAGETNVCVSQHNIPFKKKHRGGGHMRGSN